MFSVRIVKVMEDRIETLEVPLRVFIKHCEVYGGMSVGGIARKKYTIIDGYVKVDGEKMESLAEAEKLLRKAALRVKPADRHLNDDADRRSELAKETLMGMKEQFNEEQPRATGEEEMPGYAGPSLIRVLFRLTGKMVKQLYNFPKRIALATWPLMKKVMLVMKRGMGFLHLHIHRTKDKEPEK